MDNDKILRLIATTYDKIYKLEKQRREINKKIKNSKTTLKGLLNYIRKEIK